MKTCLQNCQSGDKIIWARKDQYGNILNQAAFLVIVPFVEEKIVTVPVTRDGGAHISRYPIMFYQNDLYPSNSGFIITKIIKAEE